MPAPDYDSENYEHALAAAKDAIGVSSSDITKDAALGRRLLQTAIGPEGYEVWRPYAAAYRWLRANPKWIVKTTGSEGVEYRSLDEVLKGLAEEQATEDARLKLSIPEHLKVLTSGGVPGPIFTGWR